MEEIIKTKEYLETLNTDERAEFEYLVSMGYDPLDPSTMV